MSTASGSQRTVRLNRST